jgi:LPXTG-motif cell wall-anchored protein
VFIPASHLRRLGCVAAVFFLVTAISAPARAAADGYVRLAHLSPDTPAVDVYLRSSSDAIKPQTFKGVAYGAMSAYLRLPTGNYQVAMRKAGAPADTKPVLTTDVDVANGGAYTVAGVGRYADLGLRVLRDDLKLPDPGKSKVRIIQASVKAPVLDVAGQNGTAIADNVEFATTTAYREVDPGRWSVRVVPTGGGKTSVLPCTLGAGSVYSLVVLDDKGGGLKPELHVDAERQGAVPLGGVATGDGGSQTGSRLPMALLLAGLAAILSGGLVMVLRRRLRAV